jgi:uncharacterized membrane protein
MPDNLIVVLTIAAALGSGLIAGVFFAFSTSVMSALGRLPSDQGMTAMQHVNVIIINPLFLGVFLGTAFVCAVLTVVSLIRWDRGSMFVLAGAALYLVGSILVTMAINVPMNNALMAARPDDPNSADLWANYLSNWTFWNHIRAAASLCAAAAFTIALVRPG